MFGETLIPVKQLLFMSLTTSSVPSESYHIYASSPSNLNWTRYNKEKYRVSSPSEVKKPTARPGDFRSGIHM